MSDAAQVTSKKPSAPPGASTSADGRDVHAASGEWFGLTPGDQRFLVLILVVLLALLAVHWYRLSRLSVPATRIERPTGAAFDYHVRANEATWVEWSQLDGIGPTLAKRIVADRAANGPYRTLDDLRRVKGVGPKTLDKLRGFVHGFEGDESAPPATASVR
jgi:competence protein ComEA